MAREAKRVLATARVRLVVDLPNIGGPYGPEWTIADIHRDAARAALGFIARIPEGRLRVVGEPEVVVVTTEEDR